MSATATVETIISPAVQRAIKSSEWAAEYAAAAMAAVTAEQQPKETK